MLKSIPTPLFYSKFLQHFLAPHFFSHPLYCMALVSLNKY